MSWTLVTGGAKNLGAEICRTLAKRGHKILVHYNTSQAEANEVVNTCKSFGVNAESIQGDFSSRETTQKFIEKLLKHYPDVKNLINNVGNFLVKSPTATMPDEWEALFQINYLAPLALTQALVPAIQKAKGNIINIGVSGLEPMRANTTFPAYASTKNSLLLLTKSLAKELADSGVCVNMVSPGQLENSIDRPETPAHIPMHRFGTFYDVARIVAFLLEDESGYITGQNIEAAGGLGI